MNENLTELIGNYNIKVAKNPNIINFLDEIWMLS